MFHVEHYKGQAWNNLWNKCGTILNFIRKYFKIGLLGLLTVFLLLLIAKVDFNSLFLKSLAERSFYIDVSRGTISDHFFVGTGAGQFVLDMQNYSKQVLEFWQFQPVHNVFLLICSELGFVGLVLWIYLIFELVFKKSNVPRGTTIWNIYFKAVFIGFLLIMLFDHYLWDIHQGQILIWLVLGLIVGSSNYIDKK